MSDNTAEPGRTIRLLAIADVHSAPAGASEKPSQRTEFGEELVRRAVVDARNRGGFDAVLLLGDLVNTADQPDAPERIAAIAQALKDELPPRAIVLAVAGNHDPAGAIWATFGPPGVTHHAGCRFVTMEDCWEPDGRCTRPAESRRLLRDLAGDATGPIVVLQHNPLHPAIEADYPYMPLDRDETLHDYRRAGVAVSISGHYHAGQPLSMKDGTAYLTVPSLCEAPYQYALVTLDGSAVRADVRSLALDGSPAVVDTHAHSEFAYCGEGVSAELVEHRARMFGLAGVCVVEHAPQLYCSKDDFFIGEHVRKPKLWRKGKGRMAAFRQAMASRRSDFVRLGLEVELDADGQLTLRDEDRDWPDLLVGAIHFLPKSSREMNNTELADMFMATCRGLIDAGVDVLAHPWRVFAWASRSVPTHLYGELAAMLAEAGVAAEINLHKNANDPAFFAEVIARGGKITLGSDSHCPHEAGAMTAHLDILRTAAGSRDLNEFLWRPGKRRTPK